MAGLHLATRVLLKIWPPPKNAFINIFLNLKEGNMTRGRTLKTLALLTSLLFIFCGTGFAEISYYFQSTKKPNGYPDVTMGTDTIQGAQLGYSMVKGDFNGDGVQDIAVSAPREQNPLDETTGMVMIFYGGSNAADLPLLFVTGQADSTHANVRMFSRTVDGLLGARLAAGKLNDDAIDDLVIVEQDLVDNAASKIYVVFGKSDLEGSNGIINLSTSPDVVLERTSDTMFICAITVGDVDGDNQEDLILSDILTTLAGCPPILGSLDPHKHPTTTDRINGAVYIVKGPLTSGSTIDLVTAADHYILRSDGGASGSARFQVGSIAVGDVTGDGKNELILSNQYLASDFSLENAGAVYVINAGSDFPTDKVLDIDAIKDMTIYGGWQNDYLGSPFSTVTTTLPLSGQGTLAVGDVNDDDINDIIIGSPLSGSDKGKVEIVYGKATLPASINLNNLLGDDADVRITLSIGSNDDKTGYAIVAEDVNGDGIDDLLIGSPQTQFNSTTYNGWAHIVFGKSSLNSTYDLAADADIGFYAAEPTDAYAGGRMGTTLLVGDFNDSGMQDLVFGAPAGSTPGTNNSSGWVGIVWDAMTKAADFNCDNLLDMKDLIMSIQSMTGEEPTIPNGCDQAKSLDGNGQSGLQESIIIQRVMAQ